MIEQHEADNTRESLRLTIRTQLILCANATNQDAMEEAADAARTAIRKFVELDKKPSGVPGAMSKKSRSTIIRAY